MGGRGSSSGIGSKDGVFATKKPTTIQTTYTETPRGLKAGYFHDEVLEAKTDGFGNVTFSFAKNGEFSKTAKTNKKNTVTYELVAGAVNGKTFNINWSKVNSISGQTFSIKSEAKKAGLAWDGKTKKWIRRK